MKSIVTKYAITPRGVMFVEGERCPQHLLVVLTEQGHEIFSAGEWYNSTEYAIKDVKRRAEYRRRELRREIALIDKREKTAIKIIKAIGSKI